MQVGAAAASTAAFYTGTAVMTALLIRKGVLQPTDLRNAPSAAEVSSGKPFDQLDHWSPPCPLVCLS